MYVNSLKGLLELIDLQVEMATLPEMTDLRKTQVRTQLTLERATEKITDQLVSQLTGPEAKKIADIKSASELIALLESMKIDSYQAKEKLSIIINAELEGILKKYS